MNLLFIRILEILLVPYVHKEALWTIAPLVFVVVMIQMYFGKYKTEQLGWNTAFGNNISLLWVTAILIKYLSNNYGLITAWNTLELRGYFILIAGLGILTLILAILTYNHMLPKKWAFLLLSSLPTNLLAYFVLVIVMGTIPLDKITFLASVLIFAFIILIFWAYKRMITPVKSAIPILKKHEQERKRNLRKLKRKLQKIIPLQKKEEILSKK